MAKELDNQTLYEIFRACRLCGAGGGYKMPIIQTIDGFECPDVELRQKIKECVQIEVSQGDKMPPLICELCVDKVNDFYEFLDMCRKTNKRTRHRLGLPPSSIGVSDPGDCILGVTEPVFLQEDEAKPLSSQVKSKNGRREKPQKEVHKKKMRGLNKELESLLNDTNIKRGESRRRNKESRSSSTSSRSSRSGQLIKYSVGDELSLSKLRALEKKTEPKPPPPKSILKKEKDIKQENFNNVDDSLLAPRPKRPRTEVKIETPPKKVKIATPPPGPKSSKSKPRPVSPSPSPGLACRGCGQEFRSIQGLKSHQRSCNGSNNQKHVERSIASSPVPVREPLVGGKCSKCSQSYQMAKNLRKHESMCKGKKRAEEVKIKPKVHSRSVPQAQVRVARCDSLLKTRRGRYYVGGLDRDFGLDPRCVYPYASYPIRVKSEPLDIDGMVSIKQDIKDEIYTEEDYVHWDSDLSSDSDEDIDMAAPKTKKVDSLTTLALKTIFSKRCLGKVPRKLRKIKTDKFDLFNDFDNITDNINSIIDNLGNDDSVSGNGTIGIGNDNDSAHLSVNENSDAVDYDSDSLLNVQGSAVCDPHSSLSDKSNDKNSNNDNANDVQNDEITSLNDNGGVTDASTEDEVSNNLGTEESEVSTTYNTVKHKAVEQISDTSDNNIENNDNDSVSLEAELSAKDSSDKNDSQDENNDVRNDDNAASENDSQNNDNENNMVSEKDDNDSENTNTEKVNGGKSELINEIDDLIYDDDHRRLMADIDDQIGENGTAFENKRTKDVIDKITLEDLMTKPNNLDLDNVSDTEFNFDA